MQWRDQVALVTGGARGIGRATARQLAQHGAAVCVNYAAHPDAAAELVAEITGAGGRAIAAKADVAVAGAVEAMVARTEKELGAVTILVNNAGISWRGTLDDYDAAAVARMRRINVEGLIHATRAVVGGMRQRRYNAVAPGFVHTDLTQGGRGAGDWQETERRFAAKTMLGRIGQPNDVANAIAFLAAPQSGWITAQMLTVDGGRMDYIGHG